jgi:hypothetical protein
VSDGLHSAIVRVLELVHAQGVTEGRYIEWDQFDEDGYPVTRVKAGPNIDQPAGPASDELRSAMEHLDDLVLAHYVDTGRCVLVTDWDTRDDEGYPEVRIERGPVR